MYNYKHIHKKAYITSDITGQEAANMSNAFGGGRAASPNAGNTVINNNIGGSANGGATNGSSVVPWLLLGGGALAGLYAWHIVAMTLR